MSASIAPENTLLLELESGVVTIELLPDLAPKHVERIKALASAGFYDGTPFHRVIEGFMAQGGDPTGTGTGGSDHPDLPAEFTPPANLQRGGSLRLGARNGGRLGRIGIIPATGVKVP